MRRMSLEDIPSGGLSMKFMQKTAFYEIGTLLSHTFLRGRRVCGYSKVPEKAFHVYNPDSSVDRIQKKKG